MAKLIDITGKAISGEWGTDDLVGNGVPVLRTTNFTNIGIVNFNNVVTRQIDKKSISEKLLRYGDIIIEKSGGSDKQPVGRVVFFEGEDNKYLFNNFTGLLRVRDFCKWNPKYIFYSLFANYAKGGTIPFENRTTGLHNLQTDSYVNSVMIMERKIEEQTDIVTILDKVNQLINYEKKQLEDLDILVKSRFIEMFGNEENNFNNIPITEIGEHCKVQGGYAFRSKNFTEEGIRLVQIGNVNKDSLDWEVINYLPMDFAKYYPDYLLKNEDLLIAMTRPIIKSIDCVKIAMVSDKDIPSLLNQRVGRFMVDENIINKTFLLSLLKMRNFKIYVDKMSGNSLQPNISSKQIEEYKIPVPPLELQNQFADFVTQVNKSKLVIQQSLDELETLKKSLMQQYFG